MASLFHLGPVIAQEATSQPSPRFRQGRSLSLSLLAVRVSLSSQVIQGELGVVGGSSMVFDRLQDATMEVDLPALYSGQSGYNFAEEGVKHISLDPLVVGQYLLPLQDLVAYPYVKAREEDVLGHYLNHFIQSLVPNLPVLLGYREGNVLTQQRIAYLRLDGSVNGTRTQFLFSLFCGRIRRASADAG